MVGSAHLEVESAEVVSLDPPGITRGDTETEQGFRGEFTRGMEATEVPPQDET